jgi:hypothetical protein
VTPSNPFATRFVRPGAVPYFFPPGESAATLAGRLRETGWWGQVVGPHGSGKSTLLAALLPELRRAGLEPLVATLHDGQRRLPGEVWRAEWRAATVVVVDGYEQLSGWQRFRLKRRCRRYGCGLLVTSHGTVGLAELYRTPVAEETAERVVEFLLARSEQAVTPEEVRGRLSARAGNLREALFDLYDLHELRREART